MGVPSHYSAIISFGSLTWAGWPQPLPFLGCEGCSRLARVDHTHVHSCMILQEMKMTRGSHVILLCAQCNFIFRAQELDLGRLATALALLKLPGMPELAHQRTLPNFTPSTVDPGTIKVTCHLSAMQIRVCKSFLSGVNTVEWCINCCTFCGMLLAASGMAADMKMAVTQQSVGC